MAATELDRAIEEAPDPELARVAVSRIAERPEGRELLADPRIAASAIPLLGFSPAAADALVRRPRDLEALRSLDPRTRVELDAELEHHVGAHGVPAGIRRFRRGSMRRVAARDLLGSSVDDIVGEITAIAEACLGGGLGVL